MTYVLDFLAICSVISGILVITSSNPVISVLFLITVFILAACYLITIGVNFVGLAYLIVYVGAVAVLFLFVVIILNIRVSEIVDVGLEHSKNLPLGFIVGILFTFEFLSIVPAFSIELGTSFFTKITAFYLGLDSTINLNEVYISSIGPIADTGFSTYTQIQALGQGLYTHGSFSLLLAGILLLLSMIGPILTCQRQDDSV